MIRSLALSFTCIVSTAILAGNASAHCQVPCGIYGDQLRFQSMLEDEDTIAKAQVTLADVTSHQVDAQSVNQMARWVVTKESHAQNIQETMLNYFLAQRIKPDSASYLKQLTSAHAVIIAAMKAKQSADPATAKALETAIFNFYRAYEGKEPAFETGN
ncbi:MAG: superoxide dismutase [Ni] [Planctomycetota bacterium]